MNQNKAPLYEALLTYERKKNVSFHVPGHKDGTIFDGQAKERYAAVLAMDGTEVEGLDDLHHPRGAIADAQQLAAEAFGADQTFFLVGGSTAGNLAAALSLCDAGDCIIVQRNAHKSVFNGLLLAEAHPVFVFPNVEPETGVALGLTDADVSPALQAYPDAKAVWITNPNYYGMGQDIKKIAHVCHRAGVPLIVDEAHGAHFGQSANVPVSALASGADLVVQSTHKMLTSMTMSSMLHVKGDLIPRERLAAVLAMIQSSSPSYPLMASLDVARRHLVIEGRKILYRTVERLENKREQIQSELTCLSIYGGGSHVFSRDPLKWVVTCKHPSVSGYRLLTWLQEMGCIAEMADTRNVVLVFSIDINDIYIDKLHTALLRIDETIRNSSSLEEQDIPISDTVAVFAKPGTVSEVTMSLRTSFMSTRKIVPIEQAIGCYCAEMVIPYPPGIPLLLPGESIMPHHLEAIRHIREAGGVFQGAADDEMKTIAVLSKKQL
ncbi:aminotransferase class I/II-fold pyridoxal phosphate-dependent enzyme [Aneurinibacillus terranovensis]|uniref:aminotransferase class I/II-fold pyridoxal phosphate-dependent enzyme n=1 Tax=Aneurinibacillus terranovensis TaxID=278991 RepID=UPI000401D414|nr:aminotransferase class V-fold PLP-dependent enzyme [Aneurinibacillus terranovensis]